MTLQEWDTLVGVLTEASPKSIFLEVAFLESYVASCEKRMVGIPLAAFEEMLPYLEDEFKWKPRVIHGGASTHPAWWQAAAAFALYGSLASGAAGALGS